MNRLKVYHFMWSFIMSYLLVFIKHGQRMAFLDYIASEDRLLAALLHRRIEFISFEESSNRWQCDVCRQNTRVFAAHQHCFSHAIAVWDLSTFGDNGSVCCCETVPAICPVHYER